MTASKASERCSVVILGNMKIASEPRPIIAFTWAASPPFLSPDAATITEILAASPARSNPPAIPAASSDAKSGTSSPISPLCLLRRLRAAWLGQ